MYRNLPDPGLLIGQAINALARGFAEAAMGTLKRSDGAPWTAYPILIPATHPLEYMIRRIVGEPCDLFVEREPAEAYIRVTVRCRGLYFTTCLSEMRLRVSNNQARDWAGVIGELADQVKYHIRGVDGASRG